MLIRTKLVGVSFGNRQASIRNLPAGTLDRYALGWRREPENPYDKNSILVMAGPYSNVEIGHLNKEVAADVSPRIDAGVSMRIYLTGITGQEKMSRGVNVLVELYDGVTDEVADGKTENVSPQN